MLPGCACFVRQAGRTESPFRPQSGFSPADLHPVDHDPVGHDGLLQRRQGKLNLQSRVHRQRIGRLDEDSSQGKVLNVIREELVRHPILNTDSHRHTGVLTPFVSGLGHDRWFASLARATLNRNPSLRPAERSGAGNGTRTRDTQLGKLELYQLSYARSFPRQWMCTSRRIFFFSQKARLLSRHRLGLSGFCALLEEPR